MSYGSSDEFGNSNSGPLGTVNPVWITVDAWIDNWQKYKQEYRKGVAYIIANRSGMSPEDVYIQQLATQISTQVSQPMSLCEFGVDAPATMAIIAGPWVEGTVAYVVYGSSAAGTMLAWSACK